MSKYMRVFLVCGWFFFSCLVLLNGQSTSLDLSVPLPMDSSIQRGILDNGLRYYYRYNNEPRDRVELRLFVRAGSLQEEADQLGIAHFVEHMAFNGTAHFEKNTLIDFLERHGSRFGADINAYTSFDKTVYKLEVQTDTLAVVDTALQILADWAGGVEFDSLEVAKERGIIRSEWRSGLNYRQRLNQQVYPVTFRNSRYAERLPIGDIDLIDTIPFQRLKDYYERWYQPQNMAIAVVGNIDTAWLQQRIESYFTPLKNTTFTAPEQYALSSEQRQDFVLATDPEAPFTRWTLTYQLSPTADLTTTAQLRQQLLYQLYGQMLNKRFAALQEREVSPFTFASSRFSNLLNQYRTYELSAMVKPEQFMASLAAVITETQRVAEHGFLAEELTVAKANIQTSYEQFAKERDKMTNARWASRINELFYEQGQVLDLEQLSSLIARYLADISLEDLLPLASSWQMNPTRVATITTNNEDALLLPDSAAFYQAVDSLLLLPTAPPPEKQQVTQLLSLPSSTIEPVLIAYDTVINVKHYQLQNGLNIFLKPTDFQNDVILLRATSPGGTSLVNDERFASARFATSIINNSGIDTLTASTLLDYMGDKRANVGPFIGPYEEGFGGSTNQEDLETAFQLLHLYFTRPRVDSLALLNFTTRQLDIYEQIDRDPRSAFGRMVADRKYDYHLRRPNSSTEQIAAIQLDHILATYQERFANPADFKFVFVGSFEEDKLLPLAQQYLGALKPGTASEKWQDDGVRYSQHPIDTVVLAGQTPKAEVLLDWHADFPYADRNARLHFIALRQLLDIRLREELREEMGGVYGVRLTGRSTAQPDSLCFMNIRFNAEPEQVEELVQGVYTEIQAIANGDIAASNMEKIKAKQIKSLEERQRSNRSWLASLVRSVAQQRPFSQLYFDNYLAFIETINAEDIQVAAQRYLLEGVHFKFVLLPEG